MTKKRGNVLTLGDAWGKSLRRPVVLSGPGSEQLWTGDPASVSAGVWQVERQGQPGLWEVDIEPGGAPDLGSLGALEVHLKAPEGTSLRYAPLHVHAGELRWKGLVGVPLELPPGDYTFALDDMPGFERDVTVAAGVVTKIDLGVSGVIEFVASPEHPPGSVVRLWRPDAPKKSEPLATSRVGRELLLPLGAYRVQYGAAEPVERKATRRRKVKPTVSYRFTGADS